MKKFYIKILLNLKYNYLKLNDYIKKNNLITTLLVFGFFLCYFLLLYMRIPVLSSEDDHYFHFRFAERILKNDGFLYSFRNFKTIYFTNVANGEHLLYYNFIFYLVLLPFTLISPLFLAIKLYAIVIASLIGVIIYSFIKNLGIKYPFIWSVAFFATIGIGSFWRLFLSRPFVLSPLLIILLILALHRNKYFWIFILSFIPLFWHTATFFVPLLVTVIYFLIYTFYQKKYLWKELFLVITGTILAVIFALLIDSGFFTSIKDNLFSVLSGVLNFSGNKTNIIQEGGEVYPKNFFDLFNQNVLLCLMFLSAMIYYVLDFFREIKNIKYFDNNLKLKKIIELVFFITSSVFLAAIPIISGRFADFFIFFSWIFIVLIYTEVFSFIKFTKIYIKNFLGYSIIFCLIYIFLNNTLQLNDFFASTGSRPEEFSQVGKYLSENLKKDEVVFNINWNWFTQLYYYAPEQNYVIGLEPKLTYLYEPRIYWLWKNISMGYVCDREKCVEQQKEIIIVSNKNNIELQKEWYRKNGDKIADTIVNDFKSHYIVTSKNYSLLNNILNNNSSFERVLNSNNQYYIYKIIQ